MSSIVRNLKEVIARRVKESGILPSYRVREKLAGIYLRGEGVEIGALHLPLRVPPNVRVRYVDLASREENIRRHPDLPGDRIVETDHVDDGFELSIVGQCSNDFVIANHVLEHAPNPFQVLLNWCRVLKPGGVLFISIPLAEKCFDRGRPITTLQHLLEDFRNCRDGNIGAFEDSNRNHYREWLSISEPAILRARGEQVGRKTPAQLEAEVDSFSVQSKEIHFHTFSKDSFRLFLEYFVQHVDPSYVLKELCASRGNRECVAILQKLID